MLGPRRVLRRVGRGSRDSGRAPRLFRLSRRRALRAWGGRGCAGGAGAAVAPAHPEAFRSSAPRFFRILAASDHETHEKGPAHGGYQHQTQRNGHLDRLKVKRRGLPPEAALF